MNLRIIIGGVSLLLLFLTLPLHSQTETKFPTPFIHALLYEGGSLSSFVDSGELNMSQRLEIHYEGIQNKFLISYDFDIETKRQIQNHTIEPKVTEENLTDNFKKVTIDIPSIHQQKVFFFKDDKLISPINYYTRIWKQIESKYFVFLISDSTQFHHESIQALEAFVDSMASVLQLTPVDLHTLEQEKIVYVYCKDEHEIELLTGYKSRGMYLLPYDYLVTTFSCHFHELLHLLINFRLKSLPLYTHPILQEGFAVAYGGRGGIATSTLMQTSVFLTQSKFLTYPELLSINDYRQKDASLSYPVSGLYNQFLIKELGIQTYLEFYNKYSSSNFDDLMSIQQSEFPKESTWLHFVDSVENSRPIVFALPETNKQQLLSNDDVGIEEGENYYHIRTKHSFGLRPINSDTTYRSKRYNELFPKRNYQQEHFLFTVDSTEITIYDLFTNNSLGGYSSAFTLNQQRVPSKDGWFEFWVKKDIFHSRFNEMNILNEIP